jgi:hypothetical protein
MPRKKGMIGPGATAMGGVGARPGRMPTPMAGRSPLAAPGGLPGAGGGPMGMAGAAGPPRVPRMGAPGPVPGGQPVARSPAAGMGGAAGFRRGGEAKESEKTREEMHNKRERHEALAQGGPVGGTEAFAHGGIVGGHAGPVEKGAKPLDYGRHSARDKADERKQHEDAKVRGRRSEMDKQIGEGKAGFKKGGSTGFNKGGFVGDTKPRHGRSGGGITKST